VQPRKHHPLGALVRKRRQHHVVDHAEDRRGGADAQSQRHDRDGGESPVLPEDAQGVAQVVPHAFDRGESLQRSAVLAQPRGIAELTAGGGRGVLPGQALRHETLREQPQVLVDLRIELVVAMMSAELRRERAEP
jgi:hypothetical protein